MNAQELLTAPASTLTRKQRKDRAALKRMMAAAMKLPAGYALGRAKPRPAPLPGVDAVFEDRPRQFGQPIELGKLYPRDGHVTVRIDGRDVPGVVARPGSSIH